MNNPGSMPGRIMRMKRSGVLGLNCRNGDYIMKFNRRRFYPLVDDKVLCKERLQEQGARSAGPDRDRPLDAAGCTN